MPDPFEIINDPVCIADDQEAIRIILRLGVFEKASKPLQTTKRHSVWHKIFWHRSHWILVGRYSGFTPASENGWLVVLWHKAKFSAEEMDRYIQTTARDVIEVVDLQDSERQN